LQKRKQRIGGSEASAIVGMNPYMDNNDLWEIKTGRKEAGVSDNALMQYCRDAEPYIRELFKLDFPQYKVFYEDNNMWVNDKYPFAHASLDGWLIDENGRSGILEIKTTNVLSSMAKEKWKGAVPQNYHIQVLHYMMVFEADFAVLKARLKFDYDGEIVLHERHYFFERYELEADIKALEEAERNFYQYVIKDKLPPLILPNI
jgi:putative phage-type endonuclease